MIRQSTNNSSSINNINGNTKLKNSLRNTTVDRAHIRDICMVRSLLSPHPRTRKKSGRMTYRAVCSAGILNYNTAVELSIALKVVNVHRSTYDQFDLLVGAVGAVVGAVSNRP